MPPPPRSPPRSTEDAPGEATSAPSWAPDAGGSWGAAPPAPSVVTGDAPGPDVAPGPVASGPVAPGPEVEIPTEQPGRYTEAGAGTELGRGGLGVVFAVWDELLQREVACKVLPSRSGAERFLREARATARLQHPGIVAVYDLGRRSDGLLYYTMKYVRGRTLAEAIAAAKTLADRLRLLGAFADVCQAIAYAHSRGVLHRDLKPANIMVGEFGETIVLDWGLARLVSDTGPDVPEPSGPRAGPTTTSPQLTVAGAVLGTPAYMAPEQAAGRIDALDERADVWSLGVILFEILSGRPPFPGTDADAVLAAVRDDEPPRLRRVAPDAPPELAAITDKALCRDPAGRYAGASALVADIDAFRSGVRVGAYDYTSWELLRRFLARNRLPLGVAAAGLVALAAEGAASYAQVLAERNHARDAEALALAREHDAVENLADALAERALATPEVEPLRALVDAAGSLARGERPEARGVWARAARHWRPALDRVVRTGRRCAVVEWIAGDKLICLAPDTFSVWAPDGRVLVDVPLETVRPRLAVSPRGDRAAILLADGAIGLVDVATGAVAARIPVDPDVSVRGLVFSPDGARLVTSAARAQAGIGIRAYDTGNGALLTAGLDGVYAEDLAFAPDGSLWGTTRQPSLIRVDPGLSRIDTSLRTEPSIYTLAWSPDGRWLAGAAGDGHAYVWDRLALDDPPRRLGEEGGLGWVRWSPDGRLLLHGREDGALRFWGTGTWAPLLGMELTPRAYRGVSVTADATRFAMAGPDDVEIWRLGDVPPAGDLFVAGAPSVGVGFLDGGAEIVTAGPTSYHMWSLDGAPVRTILLGKFGASATLLPDGARLGASGPEGVRILDATSGAVLRTFTTRPHTGIALVDHGRLLAAIGVDDGRITAWNLADGSERWHSDPPGYAYLFGGPEGQLVALRRTDPVEVLSPADGRVTRVSDGKGVFYAGISGNGRWGVIALTDGRVEVVDTVAAAIVDTVQPYDALDRRVSISDDGRLVAAGGSDRAIRVWDRVVGRVVAVLRGHRQSMQSLAFSPDGRLLLSSAWAGEVRSWDLSDLETPGAVLLQRAEKAANLDLDGIRLRPAEGAPDAALVDGASTP